MFAVGPGTMDGTPWAQSVSAVEEVSGLGPKQKEREPSIPMEQTKGQLALATEIWQTLMQLHHCSQWGSKEVPNRK